MKIECFRLRVLSLALILISSSVFTFCGDDTTEESTHFVYKVDKITKSVQTITGMLQTATEFDHKRQSLTITASNDFDEIVKITITNWDFQNPPENGIVAKDYDATYDAEQGENHSPQAQCLALTGANAGTTICDGAIVTYMQDGNLYTSIFTGNEEGTVTITESNAAKQSLSGSFSVQVQYAVGKKVKLTGTFTNVKYTLF